MGVFKLSKPIEYGTKVYTEVIIPDKLLAEHFKRVNPLDLDESDEIHKLISSCIHEPESYVEMLSAKDYFSIKDILDKMLVADIEAIRIPGEEELKDGFKLSWPFSVGSKTYTGFILPKEFKARHFRKNRHSQIKDGDQIIKFISSCVNEHENIVEKMAAVDMFTLSKVLENRVELELQSQEISTS